MDRYDIFKGEKTQRGNGEYKHLYYIKKNGNYIKDSDAIIFSLIVFAIIYLIPLLSDTSIVVHFSYLAFYLIFNGIIFYFYKEPNSSKKSFGSIFKAREYIESCENITKNGADVVHVGTMEYNIKGSE